MGRIVLQMMMSVDGMVSGPQGQLDWIASDEPLNRAHLSAIKQADLAVMGAGSYAGMAEYWTAAERDDSAEPVVRDIGRAFNEIPKIIYSHKAMDIRWRNARVHIVADDEALAEDVRRLKQKTKGTVLVYGGVRLARTFVKRDLIDELRLAVCPVVLGQGQPLFTDLSHRTTLRLREAVTYESGATEMYYEVANAA